MSRPEMMLWLEDTRGIYIPQAFAKSFRDREKDVAGVSPESWATLEVGPEDEWYWDIWDSVRDNAIVTDEHGNKYTVYQEGHCWLVPVGMQWADDGEGFKWPDEEEE